MRVLITGSAGFVGTNLALHLLKDKSNQVFGVDSLSRNGAKVNLEKIQAASKAHGSNFKFYQKP